MKKCGLQIIASKIWRGAGINPPLILVLGYRKMLYRKAEIKLAITRYIVYNIITVKESLTSNEQGVTLKVILERRRK